MSLDLFSEPFAAHGGFDARSTRRAIGTPDMDFWSLFLRETLQNSWDARSEDQIRFSIEADRMTRAQIEILRDEVFIRTPPPQLKVLQNGLGSAEVRLLVVSDSGTRGLGGATRADSAAGDGDSTDFVDFVRNIGRAASKSLGGGTYGFGKGVLYDASEVNTCLIYSQTLVDGRIENRFIVASVGDELQMGGKRYTGRHWWGRADHEGVLEPITGIESRALAARLGLATMAEGDTGTSIGVVNPKDSDGQKLAKIVESIARAATLWAWPHMEGLEAGPTIDFRFSAYGDVIYPPAPSEDPILQHYVRAFERARRMTASGQNFEAWPWTGRTVEMLRPARRLGGLVYRSFPMPDETSILDHTRHIALMRSPGFVVKYLEIAADPSGQATAGVFLAHPDANDDFAKAEPVAHDDWVPLRMGLEAGERNPVRVALTRIRDEFKGRIVPEAIPAGVDHPSGVAQLSRVLGSVVAGLAGTGAEVPKRRLGRGGAGAGAGRRGLSVQFDSTPQLLVEDGRVVADFHFRLAGVNGLDLSGYELDARPRVVLDGGMLEKEGDVPEEAGIPTIVGWFQGGKTVASTSVVRADLVAGDDNFVRVAQPPHTAVALEIRHRKNP